MRRTIASLEGQLAIETKAVQMACEKLKKLRFAIAYEPCQCTPRRLVEQTAGGEHNFKPVTCLRCRLLELIGHDGP